MSPRASAWFDRALAALLTLLVLASAAGADSFALVAVVLCGQTVPLLWRRSRPGAVLLAVGVAMFAQAVLLSDFVVAPTQVAAPIVAYSAARWGSTAVRYGAVAMTLFGSGVAGVVWTLPHPDLRTVVFIAALCAATTLAAWAIGLAGSQRDRYLAGLKDRADQLQRVADRDVALAAQDERARIAREMHDVVAHGLSVIVVQADGARYAAAKNPDVAVSTLETIASTGRESLQEMRRLLGVLRTGDSGVRPQPTLADVPHLVSEAAAAGTEVTAEIPDVLPHVPDGVGLAAYRCVQEALTNVRKHAGPEAKVHVRLAVQGGALCVDVTDDGRGASARPAQPSGGLGLMGMRERVGVHGGEVVSGPRVGGGWHVGARIPL